MSKKLKFSRGKHNFDMDVSTLVAYIRAPETMPTIVDILATSSIFGRIMVMEDVKRDEAIPAFETNAALQKIAGCTLTPSGTTTVSNEIMHVEPVGTSEEYCNEQLVGKWTQELLKSGLVGQNEIPEPAEILRALHLRNWRKKAEKLWWSASIASVDPQMNIIDGFYTKALLSANTVKKPLVTITAGNAWTVFYDLISLIPDDAHDDGTQYEVRTSRQNVEHLLNYIWTNKDYNGLVQGVTLADDVLDFIMPVTGFRIVSERALTNDQLIAIPLTNSFVGTDKEADWSFVDSKYDEYNDIAKIDVKGRIGAGFNKPEYIVVMDSEIVVSPSVDNSLTNGTGGNAQFTVASNNVPGTGAVTWSVSTGTGVTIDTTGKITTTNSTPAGDYTVTATSDDNPLVKGEATLTVN